MGRTVLVAFFCYWFLGSAAQTTESDRARDWLQQYQLEALAGLDSSFLSVTDKNKLILLNVDHSQTAFCAKASWKDCSGPGAPTSSLRLTGERVSNELVKLQWQTINQNNSQRFVLERRSPSDSLLYDSVALVLGKGTTTGKTKYGYIDNNNFQAITYYRVKEVNLDGTYFYSNTVEIVGVPPTLTVKVVPNPGIAGSIGFYITGSSSSSAMFTILNGSGAVVVQGKKTGLSGNTFVSMASYHLKRGLYILIVFAGIEHSAERFIVL